MPNDQPVLVTVKVNAVSPESPSAWTAAVGAIANVIESSLFIVPVAVAVVIVAGADGLPSVTVNSSSASATVSPLTLIVMAAAFGGAAMAGKILAHIHKSI